MIILSQDHFVGALQLYLQGRDTYAIAFSTVCLKEAPENTHLFTFAVETVTEAKLHIVEIDH